MPGQIGLVIDVDDQGQAVIQRFEGDTTDAFERVGKSAKGMGDKGQLLQAEIAST